MQAPTNIVLEEKLIEKSRECHKYKLQPIPNTTREGKRTEEINMCKINKQIHEKHIHQLSLPQTGFISR